MNLFAKFFSKKYIVAGLGNPEDKYKHTRHNVGWLALDYITDNMDENNWSEDKKLEASFINTNLADKKVIFAKPVTYMNNSGRAISKILNFYKLNTKQLIIVHDDVDIAFGQTKLTLDSSSGGNNGIKSIIQHLGTQEFIRLRIGIGKDENIPTDKYVLQNFSVEEVDKLPTIFTKTSQAIEMILRGDIAEAQKFYNTK